MAILDYSGLGREEDEEESGLLDYSMLAAPDQEYNDEVDPNDPDVIRREFGIDDEPTNLDRVAERSKVMLTGAGSGALTLAAAQEEPDLTSVSEDVMKDVDPDKDMGLFNMPNIPLAVVNAATQATTKFAMDIADKFTKGDIRTNIRENNKFLQQEAKAILGAPEMQYTGGSPEKLAYEVLEGATVMAPHLLAAYATKNPNVMLGGIGAQVAGQTYSDYMEKTGGDHDKSMAAVKFHVLAEVIPESIPVFAWLKKAKAGQGVIRFLEGTLGEGGQEMLTEVLTSVYDNKQLEGMSLKDAILNIDWSQVGHAGLIGLGVGGILSTPGTVADAALTFKEKRNKKTIEEKAAEASAPPNPSTNVDQVAADIKAEVDSADIKTDPPAGLVGSQMDSWDPLGPEPWAAPNMDAPIDFEAGMDGSMEEQDFSQLFTDIMGEELLYQEPIEPTDPTEPPGAAPAAEKVLKPEEEIPLADAVATDPEKTSALTKQSLGREAGAEIAGQGLSLDEHTEAMSAKAEEISGKPRGSQAWRMTYDSALAGFEEAERKAKREEIKPKEVKPEERMIETGEKLFSVSGRELQAAPMIDVTTPGKTRNSIKRTNQWLLTEAKKEVAGDDYQTTLINAIDLKNLSQSDQDTLNQVVFGDAAGPSNAVNRTPKQEALKAKAQAKPVETPVEPLEDITARPTSKQGNEVNVHIPSTGAELKAKVMVVEGADLIASNDDAGNVNPRYPAELQPRDRKKGSSLLQIQKIAKNLKPELLVDNGQSNGGSPIIGADGVIESGNGRTLAIMAAYKAGNADGYRKYITAQAASQGISGADIESMENPVMVRVRQGEMDMNHRAEFARQSNQSGLAPMTPTENARADAVRITDDDMTMFMPDSSGNVLAASNQEFLKRFGDRLGDLAVGGLSTPDGRWTKQMADRVTAAVFYKAYGDEKLLALTAEEADPDIKNILNGLNQAAPAFARARSITEDLGELDIITDIVGAIDLVRKAKADSTSVEQLVAQAGLFGDVDPVVGKIGQFLESSARSSKRIGKGLSGMAEFLENELNNLNQESLFNLEPATKADIVEAANKQIKEIYGDDTQTIDLFAEGPATQGENQQGAGQRIDQPGSRDRQPGESQGAETETTRPEVLRPATPENIAAIENQGKDYVPQSTVKAYKLFTRKKGDLNTLYPLFVDADIAVPIGEWTLAHQGETHDGKVKSKIGHLANRPGWHSGALPVAPQIGKKNPGDKKNTWRAGRQIWAEVEIPADIDWQTEANNRAEKTSTGKLLPRTAHITDQIPAGGYYKYKTNPNQPGEWMISGAIKVNRILTDEEVTAINSQDLQDLPRKLDAQGNQIWEPAAMYEADGRQGAGGAETYAIHGMKANGADYNIAGLTKMKSDNGQELYSKGKGESLKIYQISGGVVTVTSAASVQKRMATNGVANQVREDTGGHAKAGGERGLNGEWYEGGQFMPASARTKKGAYKYEPSSTGGSGMQLVEPGVFARPPEGAIAIFGSSRNFMYIENGKAKLIDNDLAMSNYGGKTKFQKLRALYNKGWRFIDKKTGLPVPHETPVEAEPEIYPGYEIPPSQGEEFYNVKEEAIQYDFFDSPEFTQEESRAQAADIFNVEYIQREAGQLSVGTTNIQTHGDAAHVLAPIRKHAQETMMVVVTDKAGEILNVIRHSKGTKDGASAYPTDIVGAIAGTEGAANYWLAHNHPSGVHSPSQADIGISMRIKGLTDGMGVDYSGHVIIGDGYTYMDTDTDVRTPFRQIPPMARNKKVSVTERTLKRRIKDPLPGTVSTMALTSPNATREYIEQLDSESGVLLTNNRNVPIGVIALTRNEMGKLRDGTQVNRILKAFNSTNAAAGVIFTKDKGDSLDAINNDDIENVSNFLARYKDGFRILDIFTPSSSGRKLVSHQEMGNSMGHADQIFFRRGDSYADMEGKELTYQVEVESTGETHTMTVDAGQAMRDIDARLDALEELRDCI